MPAAVLGAGSTPAADNQENKHPRRDGLRNCGTGSALEGLYDVLNNEEFESQNSRRQRMTVVMIGGKGVSGETERQDDIRIRTAAGVPLPMTV